MYLPINSIDDLVQREPEVTRDIDDDIDKTDYLGEIFNRVNDYAIGYHYNSGKYGLLAEFHAKDLFKNSSLKEVSAFGYSKPSIYSYHLGFHRSIMSSRLGFWDSIHFRAGCYLKNINFENSSGKDFAVTLGVGINKGFNKLDLGLKFGKIKIASFEENTYYKAILSIQLGDRWFANSRRKND